MKLKINTRAWMRNLCLALAFTGFTALAQSQNAGTPAASVNAADLITSPAPTKLEAEQGAGIHGRLAVAPEIVSADTSGDLIYTITIEPLFGRVGLAGGEEGADFYATKTSRLGYFAYQPRDDYTGEDSFTYTVRNETSGLVFKNTVVVTVKPAAPIELDKFVVSGDRDLSRNARPVNLTTRPNTAITQKIPSHTDFMAEADRANVTDPKIAYVLVDKSKPQNGTAKLDRYTGQLTYAPNPGFIGDDEFRYYTVDENNTHLGVENTVIVKIEPVRDYKQVIADRTKSREVDLVFVINNSPSMAQHQTRIADNLRRFRQLFDERKLDYRIGVLTTDFVNTDQRYFKTVRSVQLDRTGNPVLDSRQRPKQANKQVASNGTLVTLPVMEQPWVTPQTPDRVFGELVKVGTNGDSNRTAFTAVYNFVSNYQSKQHTLLRPDATTIVVYFMDEEETRMAVWKDLKNGERQAEWNENGKLPDLLNEYNARNPAKRQTLDGYINYWVLRPFIVVKGNKRGKIEMHAVVSPKNISHRRAAELTGGTALNIESDFSAPLAALGDRIADTVAVALEPVGTGAIFSKRSLRVLVDGQEVKADADNGYIYDERTHSIRFQGTAKKQAFAAKIEVTYEEHR
ncbi:Ig-like domain-containing protein [Oleiharenicola lentus]|uniref:Ig-like domain-containing protein n=1 Tax=Oleiharenicola lentus TaxID=2508720 RepID=UPI003F67ABE1